MYTPFVTENLGMGNGDHGKSCRQQVKHLVFGDIWKRNIF
jgi:hypothetical protein